MTLNDRLFFLFYTFADVIANVINAGKRAFFGVSGFLYQKPAAFVKVCWQYIGTAVITALGMLMDRSSHAELNGKEREEIYRTVDEAFARMPQDFDCSEDEPKHTTSRDNDQLPRTT